MGEGLSELGRFSDPALFILASLADGDKHGYAMMEDIEALRWPGWSGEGWSSRYLRRTGGGPTV